MQRVHSYYCHLNLERRDLRAATQRSACLQSNSACCQNRAPPEFRGAKPHGNSAKIILFFQISTLRQEIASGRCRFSGNRAGTDAATAVPLPGTGFPTGLPQRRRCFAAGDPPENVGHFPTGKTRNARRGYISASNVPNTRRICSPLSGLATYSLAPAARAFCRSRS
jgi:hypothetical protein